MITDWIVNRSILFNFNKSYKKYGKFVLDIIKQELYKRNVTTFFNSGTTKIVYNTINPDYIVKVIICDISLLNKLIREPIEMMNNDICNTPINIKIISKNKINIDNIQNENYDIGSYCIIIWTEEKANVTGLSNFPINIKDDAKKWYNITKLELEKNNFTDLGEVNIGYFKTKPYFRWIDIQPNEEILNNDNLTLKKEYENIDNKLDNDNFILKKNISNNKLIKKAGKKYKTKKNNKSKKHISNITKKH